MKETDRQKTHYTEYYELLWYETTTSYKYNQLDRKETSINECREKGEEKKWKERGKERHTVHSIHLSCCPEVVRKILE